MDKVPGHAGDVYEEIKMSILHLRAVAHSQTAFDQDTADCSNCEIVVMLFF